MENPNKKFLEATEKLSNAKANYLNARKEATPQAQSPEEFISNWEAAYKILYAEKLDKNPELEAELEIELTEKLTDRLNHEIDLIRH